MAKQKLANVVYKLIGFAILLLSFAGGWLAMDYKHYVSPIEAA